MTTKYHEASDVLTDITKGLSLGTKTSSDTAARKLMMAVRQNQEFRKELLNTLQQTGGKDITGKLAAASLAPWTAKGIAGAVQTVAGGAGAMESFDSTSFLAYLDNLSCRFFSSFSRRVCFSNGKYKPCRGENC